jgi:hypothetical protein
VHVAIQPAHVRCSPLCCCYACCVCASTQLRCAESLADEVWLIVACCVCAGEQRKRDYDWSKAKIDPKQHRFGSVDSRGQQSSMKQVSVGAVTMMLRRGC